MTQITPFAMYLRNAPVYYCKDGERRPVFHTVTADELESDGWCPEDSLQPSVDVQPEPEPEHEPEPEPAPLDSMTKAQLIEYANDNGIDLTAGATKAEILQACEEASNG